MAEHRRYLAPGSLVGVLLLCSSCALVFVATKVDPSSMEPCANSLPQAALANRRHFDHVLIVVFENQTYKRVLADSVFKKLAAGGRLFDNFHGLFHPSYSNYLAMVSGREIRT